MYYHWHIYTPVTCDEAGRGVGEPQLRGFLGVPHHGVRGGRGGGRQHVVLSAGEATATDQF